MTLLGKLGLSPESAALEGTPDEVDARVRAAHDRKLRPARVEAARRISGWHEIEDDLVARHRGWLVSAGSDRIYIQHKGVVWAGDSVVPLADTEELSFVVGDELELRFYQRVRHPATWSEYVRRQAAKELQKTTEKPTPELMK